LCIDDMTQEEVDKLFFGMLERDGCFEIDIGQMPAAPARGKR
jgi:hypothetical protein